MSILHDLLKIMFRAVITFRDINEEPIMGFPSMIFVGSLNERADFRSLPGYLPSEVIRCQGALR
jgi:hypothetical protein